MKNESYETKATLVTGGGRVIELTGLDAAQAVQAAEALKGLNEMARPFDALISGLLTRRLCGRTTEADVKMELEEYETYLSMRAELVADIARHEPQTLRDALKVA